MDKLFQIALRIAYRLLRVWWWIRRPAYQGSAVAIWCGGEILLVQTSYRPSLGLPGGGVHRGEDPMAAALRELREECALDLPPSALSLRFEMVDTYEKRRDLVRIYETTLAERPTIRVDNREILWARFFDLDAALASRIAPHLRRYLEMRAVARPPGQASR
ncbi:MAG TPA: NUDIX hydrolase [Stellaceae bacterium]|nr:NUDIX hydrolase [Stellaceae bacterium]